VRRVREIKGELAVLPPPAGLQAEVTGNAAMGELLDANAKHDVDRTTLWAFGAVAVILLLIYRSPVAMFLPLLTIAASLMVSLGAIGGRRRGAGRLTGWWRCSSSSSWHRRRLLFLLFGPIGEERRGGR
jgi:hypothetical protein